MLNQTFLKALQEIVVFKIYLIEFNKVNPLLCFL